MKSNTTQRLSTWTFWSPLKFALISFGTMIVVAFIFSLIFNPTQISRTSVLTITTLSLIFGAFVQVRTLPKTNLDQSSFITIHNSQTLILTSAFLLSSFFVIKYAQQILFNLLMLETQISSGFLLALIAGLIFYLFLIGLLIANAYAKFRKIRAFNIPTWKIILCVPFGFSALWTPGYILNTPTQNASSIIPTTPTYKKIHDWIIARPTHTITSYIFITLISGFFFGFGTTLLTFSLALIFGLWVIQSGQKKFIKNIDKKYSTATMIFNLTILISTILYITLIPATSQNVQITISDTYEQSEPTNTQ